MTIAEWILFGLEVIGAMVVLGIVFILLFHLALAPRRADKRRHQR